MDNVTRRSAGVKPVAIRGWEHVPRQVRIPQMGPVNPHPRTARRFAPAIETPFAPQAHCGEFRWVVVNLPSQGAPGIRVTPNPAAPAPASTRGFRRAPESERGSSPFHTFPPVSRAANGVRCHEFLARHFEFHTLFRVADDAPAGRGSPAEAVRVGNPDCRRQVLSYRAPSLERIMQSGTRRHKEAP